MLAGDSGRSTDLGKITLHRNIKIRSALGEFIDAYIITSRKNTSSNYKRYNQIQEGAVIAFQVKSDAKWRFDRVKELSSAGLRFSTCHYQETQTTLNRSLKG